MRIDFSKWGPATVLVVVLVVVIVVAGAAETVVNPATLSFPQYLAALVGAATASGVLGVGRGIHAASNPGPGTFDPADLANPELDDPDYGSTSGGGAVPRAEHVNLGDPA